MLVCAYKIAQRENQVKKSRKVKTLIVIKILTAVTVLILMMFKILLIGRLGKISHISLLFSNTFIAISSIVVLEILYFIMISRDEIKVPGKKESVVHTQKNELQKKRSFEFDKLDHSSVSDSHRENEIAKSVTKKRVLYILGTF